MSQLQARKRRVCVSQSASHNNSSDQNLSLLLYEAALNINCSVIIRLWMISYTIVCLFSDTHEACFTLLTEVQVLTALLIACRWLQRRVRYSEAQTSFGGLALLLAAKVAVLPKISKIKYPLSCAVS